ncbi:hypothetical protein [Rhodococcus jostii]|uniref:hypothetical protein n=1 Tax=Rhodococcus jostii TaxID=132919 RepID=UPI00294AA652|nr:hypothetical protein [Rhodococcus jostii]
MSETNMGRVPVGDPIPLRFDPTTKRRLKELAAGIGPRRFGALVRVSADTGCATGRCRAANR